MNLYRVWMKDGSASLQRAENEETARQLGEQLCIKACEGVRMSTSEYITACTVDRVEIVSQKRR